MSTRAGRLAVLLTDNFSVLPTISIVATHGPGSYGTTFSLKQALGNSAGLRQARKPTWHIYMPRRDPTTALASNCTGTCTGQLRQQGLTCNMGTESVKGWGSRECMKCMAECTQQHNAPNASPTLEYGHFLCATQTTLTDSLFTTQAPLIFSLTRALSLEAYRPPSDSND